MSFGKDWQIISSSRSLIAEYGPLLDLIAKELIAEIDEVKTSGDDAFTIAKKAIVKDASKQAIADFINRIKSYGNQRLD